MAGRTLRPARGPDHVRAQGRRVAGGRRRGQPRGCATAGRGSPSSSAAPAGTLCRARSPSLPDLLPAFAAASSACAERGAVAHRAHPRGRRWPARSAQAVAALRQDRHRRRSLLAQTEVGEVARGRRPGAAGRRRCRTSATRSARCSSARGRAARPRAGRDAARRLVHEHERAAGAVARRVAAACASCSHLAGGAGGLARRLLARLEVDAERCARTSTGAGGAAARRGVRRRAGARARPRRARTSSSPPRPRSARRTGRCSATSWRADPRVTAHLDAGRARALLDPARSRPAPPPTWSAADPGPHATRPEDR